MVIDQEYYTYTQDNSSSQKLRGDYFTITDDVRTYHFAFDLGNLESTIERIVVVLHFTWDGFRDDVFPLTI